MERETKRHCKTCTCLQDPNAITLNIGAATYVIDQQTVTAQHYTNIVQHNPTTIHNTTVD